MTEALTVARELASALGDLALSLPRHVISYARRAGARAEFEALSLDPVPGTPGDEPPARELRRFFPLALWVAHLGRALDWEHMLAGSDGPGRDEWHGHVATWLRDWLARRSWAGQASQRSSA